MSESSTSSGGARGGSGDAAVPSLPIGRESIGDRALNDIFSVNPESPVERARNAAMKKKMGRLAMLRKKERRAGRNSTSTLYADGTIVKPNMASLIGSIAKSMHRTIVKGHETPSPTHIEVFDETVHPISEDRINFSKPPAEKYVYLFLSTMFQVECLPPECGIMMLAYIDRIIEKTNLCLTVKNYRRLSLGCLILATKVWEEEEVWNADFQSIFPNVTGKDLATLEKKILSLLSFNVSLNASVYAKYYFELRSIADTESFGLAPLDKEGASRLEASSAAETARLQENLSVALLSPGRAGRARAQSVDFNHSVPAAAPLILN